MNKLNCIIIHGCPSDTEKAMSAKLRTYNKHWIPWTKEQLTKKGIETTTPLMTEPWAPDYEKFKNEFEKCEISENTILIGHSCGCAFLVRWLGDTKQKIHRLILVAPWKIPFREDKLDETFYNYEIDKSIKSRVGQIIIFTSDNEEDDGKKSLNIFYESLGGKIIDLKNHGHYTFGNMKTDEFPELLNKII